MTFAESRTANALCYRVVTAMAIAALPVTAGSAQSASGAGMSARHLLGPVTIEYAVPLPGEGVAAALVDDLQIALWQPAGAVEVRRLGRNGEGPGEFRHIRMVGLVESNLWAVDSRVQRITLFPLGGGKPRVLPIPRAFMRGGEEAISTAPIAVLPGDSLLAEVSFRTWTRVLPGRPEDDPPRYAVALLAPDGAIVRLLFAVPRDDCMMTVEGGPRGGMRLPKPFCPQPYRSVSPGGRYAAVVEPRPGSGTSGTVSVMIVGADGREMLREELSFPLIAVSRTVEDSVRAIMVDTRIRNLAPQVAAAVERIPFPSHMPPARGLRVTDTGTAWLRLGDEGSGQRWVHLRPGRGLAAPITLPRNAGVIAATAEGLWLQTTDAEGDLSVAFFRVRQSR